MYENIGTFTLEQLTRFYEKRCKLLARAKTILEKDMSYIGREQEQKGILINLLDETESHIKSAKNFYDSGRTNLAQEEIQVVWNRLKRVKETMKQDFPYRPECDVEKIIRTEYEEINKLFRYIVLGRGNIIG